MGAVATHAINPTLYPSMPYDAAADFAPVTQVASTPNVLVVNPSVPASNVREFIAYAKANPGKLNFGSGSTGSAGHLAGELFKSMAGIDMTHVPYKGAAPAMSDLIGGQVAASCSTTSPRALAQIARGQGARARGHHGEALGARTGPSDDRGSRACPASTSTRGSASSCPRARRARWSQRLHDEFAQALATPDIREKMMSLGAEPVGSTPEEFADYVRAEAAEVRARDQGLRREGRLMVTGASHGSSRSRGRGDLRGVDGGRCSPAQSHVRIPAIAAMVTFGAVILSFLGGIEGGLALHDQVGDREDARRSRSASARMPSLAAWGVLWLPSPQ